MRTNIKIDFVWGGNILQINVGQQHHQIQSFEKHYCLGSSFLSLGKVHDLGGRVRETLSPREINHLFLKAALASTRFCQVCFLINNLSRAVNVSNVKYCHFDVILFFLIKHALYRLSRVVNV